MFTKSNLLHESLEGVAYKTPNKIALIFQDNKISYSKFNSKADFLASLFLKLGLKNEDLVLIMLDKSIEMVLALYGVLKAGAAYVPVDTETPTKRLDLIIRKSSPKFILTESKYISRFKIPPYNTKVISIDTIEFPRSYRKSYSTKIYSNQLAYVIFTSGTTGEPKGVMIEHGGVVNTISSLINKYHISENSRLLQFSSIAFDSSVAEIFSVLSAGGTLVIAKNSELKNISKLTHIIDNQEITTLTLPPVLLNHLDFRNNKTINTVVSVGEECPVQLANRLVKEVPHFINAYGPTECSVCVSTYEADSQLKNFVPIGKPIANTRILLLDEQIREVPFGSEGEIYFSGKGVARGYIRDEINTKASFINSPFNSNDILYKTNDRAFTLNDGNYVFLGRKDFQIKIRGNRVELEEIEKVISDFRNIIDNAVCPVKNQNEEMILNCYYTATTNIDTSVLRTYLLEHLSAYMVPNNFIRVPAMPLNISGKVDRTKLQQIPVPVREAIASHTKESMNEKLMKNLWIKMFRVKTINTKDNFFDIGGDSLLAMRLVSEINSEFNIDIDITSIFDHPVLSDLAKYIDSKTVLPKRLKPLQDEDPKLYPLSNIQKMFWVMYKLNGKSAANNITVVLNLEGNVKTQILRKSFQYIVNRHEILRSNIIEKSGVPFQRISDFININLDIINLKELKNYDSEILRISSKPFLLETETLMRVKLIRLNKKESKLVIVVPHIIADAVSLEILINDLFEVYNSYLNNTNQIYKSPSTPYREYVLSEETEAELSTEVFMKIFWSKYLEKSPHFINLPTDFSKPEEKISEEGRLYRVSLNRKTSVLLHKVAKELGVTPYILLFSAFNVFIHRISNQEDILIGTPLSIRTKTSFENTFGPFINTVVVRSRMDENIAFTEYVGRQKKNFLNIFKNQKYPFNDLAGQLGVSRNYGRNPFFNVMFDYFRENKLLNFNGNSIKRETFDNHTSKFDLTFSVTENIQKDMDINVEYSINLFKEETIKRLANIFLTLIDSLCQGYTNKISSLSIISDEEKDKILNNFNNTDFRFSKKSFIEIFEGQVRRFPNKEAIRNGNETLTYFKLNAESNKLARLLKSLNIGANVAVGVFLERSVDLIISILAIWKAGGVYVPLETEYPASRTEEMISGAKSLVVISKEKYNYLLPKYISTLNLDDRNAISFPEDNLEINLRPKSLAYIIFTSGSTQKPKGVMIEHGGMMNHLFIMINYFNLTSRSKIAQNASHCFDISVWQLVCALLVGGTTVIYSKETILNIPEFLQRVNDDRIDIIELVPSFLRVIIDLLETEGIKKNPLKDLKYLLPTGEMVKPNLVKRWFQFYPKIKVINAYGPAEASDDTNFYLMSAPPIDTILNIPIGRPLKNIKTYILDNNLNLCPIGIYGEICISGVAVAQGYINNPTKTKESFLQDPFISTKEVRLYKTGDIGRWLDDGNIEFIGRKDLQVKIHGFRIELEEIEHTLAKHPRIKEVVVVDMQDHNDEQTKYLAAYYTSGSEISFDELKDFLMGTLPYFMVPSFFIRLEKMPLNNSGKIDRKSLPQPRFLRNFQEQSKPITLKEKILIEVWKKVLKTDSVRSTDNFFEIGGDSLKAIQSVSILKERGLKLSIKDLFLYQSLKDLANHIDFGNQMIQKGSKEGRFPLSPIQNDFFDQDLFNKNHYLQAFWFDINEKIDIRALSESLTVLQLRHDSLRLRFSERHQEFSDKTQEVLTFFDLTHEDDQQARQESIMKQIFQEIDIQKGPVIKSALFKLSNRYKLLIAVHHLVIDIFSWKLLVQDLEKLYSLIKNHSSIVFPSLSSSYKDWVNALEKYANSEEISKDISYWSNVSLKIRPVFPINERHRGNVGTKQLITMDLGKKISQQVNLLEASKKISIQSLLLTAVARAASDYNQDEIPILLESLGRSDVFEEVDVTNTVGWFTTVYPVILKIFKNKLLNYNLIKCDSVLKNIPNKGIDYGVIRYMRSKDDSLVIKKAMTPQIIFNYIGEISSTISGTFLTNAKIISKDLSEPINIQAKQIEIDFYFNKDELFLEIRYPDNFYNKKHIYDLQKKINKYLQGLLAETKLIQTEPVFDLIKLDKNRYEKIYSKFENR